MSPDDIAVEIYSELDSPSNITTSGVAYWLRSNVGKLNNSIFTTFNAPSTNTGAFYQSIGDSTVDMTDKEKDVLKAFYELNYYTRQVTATMGAAALDTVIEITSDGASVRRINKNEMSKTWLQMKKDTYKELQDKINAYKIGEASPEQVAGDDTITTDREEIETIRL